ncbi:hypothetical protein F5Y16DRAFT_396118 [Xylariaceae sp. FL0255]|nr:hypothetical protein F5Y16DRAFT_396118 [Xylariaceae sp. FL0255]
MAPVIDMVRHAEAYGQEERNILVVDKGLSDKGSNEAYELSKRYPYTKQISHIVCAPDSSCVNTADKAFNRAMGEKGAIILPELRTIGWQPTSDRISWESFKQECQGVWLNLRRLPTTARDISLDDAPDEELVEKRAREARAFIRQLACQAPVDAHIVVIADGLVLHYLTGDFAGLSETAFTSYENAHFRSFEFKNLDGDDLDATLEETKQSHENSQLPLYTSLSEVEQARLKSFATRRIKKQKESFRKIIEGGRPSVQTQDWSR